MRVLKEYRDDDIEMVILNYIDDRGYEGLYNEDLRCACGNDMVFELCDGHKKCKPFYASEIEEIKQMLSES